ncbi:hypothetical protein HanIR_Chr01g0047111 [Helianthus annuus]|nr:hypothetical protein HanIR_Chr01g0047111 [Helianthus annuus]
MFTEVFYKLSKCVCEFWAECSLSFYLSGVWEWQNSRTPELTHTQHMHGYIYPAQHVWSKDSKDGPKDHLSDTMLSKDKQGPRRIVFRGLSFEAYLSMRSKDPIILRSLHHPSIRTSLNIQSVVQVNRRMVDLDNLQHKSGHRYIRTEYRQSTDTSAPTARSGNFDPLTFEWVDLCNVFISNGSN